MSLHALKRYAHENTQYTPLLCVNTVDVLNIATILSFEISEDTKE